MQQLEKDTYKKAFEKDSALVKDYYNNIEKSEQQKFLEELLKNEIIKPNTKIADIGCGGGKLSYHLSKIYPESHYYLVDYNEEAIEIARKLNTSNNFHFSISNIYFMPYEDNTFDITACLVVISFLEDTKKAVQELIRITKKGGRIIISALINFDHDVDLLTKVLDKTRKSSEQNLFLTYNTYSISTFQEWIQNQVQTLEFYKFVTKKDFYYEGKGINTYTIDAPNEKIQLAGGMILNWGFIDIIK